MRYAHAAYGLMLGVNCVRETPADEVFPGDDALPGDDEPAADEPAADPIPGTTEPVETYFSAQEDDETARKENRDSHIATALAMYQTGQGREAVCEWLAGICPASIGTPERAAKALAGHNAGF